VKNAGETDRKDLTPRSDRDRRRRAQREEAQRFLPDSDIDAALAYAVELAREGSVDLPLEIKA